MTLVIMALSFVCLNAECCILIVMLSINMLGIVTECGILILRIMSVGLHGQGDQFGQNFANWATFGLLFWVKIYFVTEILRVQERLDVDVLNF
jgi:hypothetical protein